jgi:hypothetical protein
MRRAGVAALVLGGSIALLAQLASPVAVPLYDGLGTIDPYRYLAPASGQAGSPSSYSADQPVQGGVSPTIVASTPGENPPQAQLIAYQGAFVVTATTTTMKISIQPVPAPTSGGVSRAVAGNVYRFAVTDQAGISIPIAEGGPNPPTITLRGPDGVTTGTIALVSASGSVLLPTEQGGALGIFTTSPPALGDFAIVAAAAPGSAPSIGLIVGAGLAVAVPVAVVIFLVVRQRRSRQLAAAAARPRSRIPSKRNPPRNPPRPPKAPGRRS